MCLPPMASWTGYAICGWRARGCSPVGGAPRRCMRARRLLVRQRSFCAKRRQRAIPSSASSASTRAPRWGSSSVPPPATHYFCWKGNSRGIAQARQYMESFETYRPYLFAIAYRMLGSAMDAEDIVQETYLRYQTHRPEHVDSLKAYLTTILTRLAIDQLQLATRKREQY